LGEPSALIFNNLKGGIKMMHTTSPEMQSCIDACNRCYQTCLHEAMTHCLESGGKHVSPEHMRLMLNCAEICQMSTNLMLSNSTFSSQLCRVCAEVCDAAASRWATWKSVPESAASVLKAAVRWLAPALIKALVLKSAFPLTICSRPGFLKGT
jgi:hypothetical protein